MLIRVGFEGNLYTVLYYLTLTPGAFERWTSQVISPRSTSPKDIQPPADLVFASLLDLHSKPKTHDARLKDVLLKMPKA